MVFGNGSASSPITLQDILQGLSLAFLIGKAKARKDSCPITKTRTFYKCGKETRNDISLGS